MLKLNVVHEGITDKGDKLTPGMQVAYLGHLVGGNVKIKLEDGKEAVANPNCFKELI